MKKNIDVPSKFHIKKGDTVKVTSGNSKGTTGKVLKVDRKNYRAYVEGANQVTKHKKPTPGNPSGEIVKQEAGIHISNLALINPATGEPTRVGRKLNEDGKLVRFAKKTGEVIDE
ncbi:MAG: 50S ribosomal protein L24 [Cyclobacteriaceae bacterium]|nr:50S ribosomal protein L24 [Cyclobacteriaceae bacterium]MCH8516156.1 50S ribosomal protein L24 [Cyclobacteriaceae bacterium]